MQINSLKQSETYLHPSQLSRLGGAEPTTLPLSSDSILRPKTDREIATFLQSIEQRTHPMIERELTVEEAIQHRIPLNADPKNPYSEGGIPLKRDDKLVVWYTKNAKPTTPFQNWSNAKIVAVYRKQNGKKVAIRHWSNANDFETWDGKPEFFKLSTMQRLPKRFSSQLGLIWKSTGKTISDHKFCGMNAAGFAVTTLGGNGVLYTLGYLARVAADQPQALPAQVNSTTPITTSEQQSTQTSQPGAKKKKAHNPDSMYLAAAMVYLSVTGISFLLVPALLELKAVRQKIAFKTLQKSTTDTVNGIFKELQDDYRHLLTQALTEHFNSLSTVAQHEKPFLTHLTGVIVGETQTLKLHTAALERQLHTAKLLKHFTGLPSVQKNERLTNFIDWNIRLLEEKRNAPQLHSQLAASTSSIGNHFPEKQKQNHARFVTWLNENDNDAFLKSKHVTVHI